MEQVLYKIVKSTLEKRWQLLVKLSIDLPFEAVISLLCIHPCGMTTCRTQRLVRNLQGNSTHDRKKQSKSPSKGEYPDKQILL